MTRSAKQPYPAKNDSRNFDHSCRNHGGCPWCERNRQYANERRKPVVDLDDFARCTRVGSDQRGEE
jgi:hypothetical protein